MAAHVGDHAVVADLALDGGSAQNFLVEHNRQTVVDMGSGETLEALGGILGEHEARLPACGLAVLDRLGVAQIASGDLRGAPKDVELVGRATARPRTKDL